MGIELKPHNEEAYAKMNEKYEHSNKVAIVHPTGTGKSYLALKLIEDNPGKKVIYLAPGTQILHQIKNTMIENGIEFGGGKEKTVERYTYQKLTALNRNNELRLDADIIILDEFHHCGAPEWGKAVEELLSQNPNAKVLGLSATPMRYFDDEIRDMAEELFENNVASEMTLAEAIDRGILNMPQYTTGIYEADTIYEEQKERIERITDSEKRKILEGELEELRDALNASVKGLPELLENSMTNKTGKYIVYCKDIEDMKKKMAEANEMFGRVNSEIEILSVSSEKRDDENYRQIRRFENNHDENKLKLMFSVDMLNEGYHLQELDGVIMMRPTHSPTLYDQQLGRALSVGSNKEPIIIDLVNNIDTIEIMEGFAKQFGQSSKDRKPTDTRGFKVSAETRRVQDIISKIDSLIQRKRLTNEEKLTLIKEFMEETGEVIKNDTVYKGYRLGSFKKNLRQAYYNGTLKMEDDLLQEFLDLGILSEKKERNRTRTFKVLLPFIDETRYETMSEEELKRLSKLMKSGDEGAREEFIEGYMELAYGIAKDFKKHYDSILSIELEDIQQAAMMGVVRAVDNFDFEGKKAFTKAFNNYIIRCVKQSIIDELKDMSQVAYDEIVAGDLIDRTIKKLGGNWRDTYKAIYNAEEDKAFCNGVVLPKLIERVALQLRDRYGRKLRMDDIAWEMGYSEEEMQGYLKKYPYLNSVLEGGSEREDISFEQMPENTHENYVSSLVNGSPVETHDGFIIEEGVYIEPEEERDYDKGVNPNIEEYVIRRDLGKKIDGILQNPSLSTSHRKVIAAKYGFEKGPDAEESINNTILAKKLGVSGTRIGELEAKALRILKHPKVNKSIKNFSDADLLSDNEMASVYEGYDTLGKSETKTGDSNKENESIDLDVKIETLGLSKDVQKKIRRKGCVYLGDMFLYADKYEKSFIEDILHDMGYLLESDKNELEKVFRNMKRDHRNPEEVLISEISPIKSRTPDIYKTKIKTLADAIESAEWEDVGGEMSDALLRRIRHSGFLTKNERSLMKKISEKGLIDQEYADIISQILENNEQRIKQMRERRMRMQVLKHQQQLRSLKRKAEKEGINFEEILAGIETNDSGDEPDL